jgi:galactokinase
VYVAAGRRSDARVHAHSLQAPRDHGSWLIDDPEFSDPAKGWLAYPFGVARALRGHGAVTGVDLVVDGDVPLGAGLASSAALECAVASAMSELSGLDLSGVELGLVGQAAENEYVGVPTGVMDQLAALLCEADHALFLDTRSLETRQIPFRPAASHCVLLVIDTKSRHALARANMPAVGAIASWQPSESASLRFAMSRHLISSPQTWRCTTSDSRAA